MPREILPMAPFVQKMSGEKHFVPIGMEGETAVDRKA